ncbi:hypothetical protein AALO_G00029770 [Alosa alosa]|uniref:Uncharacterized protein n=1 Tax=Alosa alosa TaxID=278164 RepID=A0AAV6HGU5_9TELE|nr:hypothetical protein AALO_G00029770 [Alosa alosa]
MFTKTKCSCTFPDRDFTCDYQEPTKSKFTMERSQWRNMRKRAIKRTNDRILEVQRSLCTGVVEHSGMVSSDFGEVVDTEMVKGHSGYAGCDKCLQPGVYARHRMTFPEVSAADRTDESFARGTDEEHHIAVSPLLEAGRDMQEISENLAIKNCEMPKETWTSYDIRVLYKANSFSEARLKLRWAEDDTDLQSEAEEGRPEKRKTRPKQRFLSSQEESDEEPVKRKPVLPKAPSIPPLPMELLSHSILPLMLLLRWTCPLLQHYSERSLPSRR